VPHPANEGDVGAFNRKHCRQIRLCSSAIAARVVGTRDLRAQGNKSGENYLITQA
jgi:hypothetical protein